MTTIKATDIFSAANFNETKKMTVSNNSHNRTLLNSVLLKNNSVTKSALCDAIVMTALQFSDAVTLMQLRQLAQACNVRSDATQHIITHIKDCFKKQHEQSRTFMQKNMTLHDNVLTCNENTLALLRSEATRKQIESICSSLYAFIQSNSKQEQEQAQKQSNVKATKVAETSKK